MLGFPDTIHSIGLCTPISIKIHPKSSDICFLFVGEKVINHIEKDIFLCWSSTLLVLIRTLVLKWKMRDVGMDEWLPQDLSQYLSWFMFYGCRSRLRSEWLLRHVQINMTWITGSWKIKVTKAKFFDLDYLPWLELRWGEFAGQDNVFRKIDCYNISESTMRCPRVKLN